jgi:hypothetical protein
MKKKTFISEYSRPYDLSVSKVYFSHRNEFIIHLRLILLSLSNDEIDDDGDVVTINKVKECLTSKSNLRHQHCGEREKENNKKICAKQRREKERERKGEKGEMENKKKYLQRRREKGEYTRIAVVVGRFFHEICVYCR